jgi:uncharacterized protein YbjT (DUF2867 family)
MKVFVAGSTGAVGKHLVPHLVESGHDVIALVRTPQKSREVEALGATATVADALDTACLCAFHGGALAVAAALLLGRAGGVGPRGPAGGSAAALAERMGNLGSVGALSGQPSLRCPAESTFGTATR